MFMSTATVNTTAINTVPKLLVRPVGPWAATALKACCSENTHSTWTFLHLISCDHFNLKHDLSYNPNSVIFVAI